MIWTELLFGRPDASATGIGLVFGFFRKRFLEKFPKGCFLRRRLQGEDIERSILIGGVNKVIHIAQQNTFILTPEPGLENQFAHPALFWPSIVPG